MLYPHVHCVVLDGVYQEQQDAPPEFHSMVAPTEEDALSVAGEVSTRIQTYLLKEGYIRDDIHLEDQRLSKVERWYLAALNERAGLVEVDQDGNRHDTTPQRDQDRSTASVNGFSVHAWTAVEAGDKNARERLCRYAARPAFASDALTKTDDGKVRFELRRPHRTGATHVELSPLQFLRRVAWLIPQPKRHMVTYAGVLAPASKLRPQIVPRPPVELHILPSLEAINRPEDDTHRRSNYILWHKLLSRVWNIDALQCACGGKLEPIAVIQEPAAIRRILQHLELSTEPPKLSPARDPPHIA